MKTKPEVWPQRPSIYFAAAIHKAREGGTFYGGCTFSGEGLAHFMGVAHSVGVADFMGVAQT